MSSESTAASSNKEFTEDDLAHFQEKQAGKWEDLKTIHTLSGHRGLDSSRNKFHAYLYSHRMIIRDAIPILNDQGQHDELLPPVKHHVRCTNCTKVWRPILKAITTTSDYLHHYKSHHPHLPRTEKDEMEMISRMEKKRAHPGLTDTPWTTAAQSRNGQRQPGEIFSEQTYRRLLTSFLIDTNSSFRLVESQSFNKLIRYCNQKVPTLSHQTIARDLREMHNELKPIIQARFQNHIKTGGKFSLTLDAWTSGNKIPYLGITAHWMDIDWDLNNTVIGFKRLRGSHTAENLCSVLQHCLDDFGIQDHIRCITADNHRVNDCLFDKLEGRLVGWRKKHGQVRCMAHVMNLAAQKILSSIKAEVKVSESEAIMAKEREGERESSPAGVLKMSRHIISKIRASNLLSEALSAQVIATKLRDLKVVIDMKVRWNSTFTMIDRMLYLKPALERLIRCEEKLGPSGFFLSANDWELLAKLKNILSIFVVATTRLSATRYPTLQMQLPYYTLLLRDLYIFKEEEKDSQQGVPALAIACEESYNLLNEYWEKTDDHSSQVIAMILDPRLKLTTFTHIGWEDEWIQKAKRKLERIFIRHYAPQSPSSSSSYITQEPENIEIDPLDELIFGGPIDLPCPGQEKSQLDIYLEEPVAVRTVTSLNWWKANSYRFPDLARMARDYMSVPASSVPAEQLFSRAGDIITKKRNRLLDSSSSSLLLVKSWLGWPEIEEWEIEAERKLELEEPNENDGDDIKL